MIASWWRRLVYRLRLWSYIMSGSGDASIDQWIHDVAETTFLFDHSVDGGFDALFSNHRIKERSFIASMQWFLSHGDNYVEFTIPPVLSLIDFAKNHTVLYKRMFQEIHYSNATMNDDDKSLRGLLYDLFMFPILSGIPSGLDDSGIMTFMVAYKDEAKIYHPRSDHSIYHYDSDEALRIVNKYDITILPSVIRNIADVYFEGRYAGDGQYREQIINMISSRMAMFLLNYGDDDFTVGDIGDFLNNIGETDWDAYKDPVFPMKYLYDMRSLRTYYDDSYDMMGLVMYLLYNGAYIHDIMYDEVSRNDYQWLHGVDFTVRPDDDIACEIYMESFKSGMGDIMSKAIKDHDADRVLAIIYVEKLFTYVVDNNILPPLLSDAIHSFFDVMKQGYPWDFAWESMMATL